MRPTNAAMAGREMLRRMSPTWLAERGTWTDVPCPAGSFPEPGELRGGADGAGDTSAIADRGGLALEPVNQR